MNLDELRDLLMNAFRGVTLDDGISIRQGEVCDNWGKGVTDEEFASIPRSEVTHDWRVLPLEELERYPYLAYLDPKGFRYYIPAFLLSLLQDANGASLRVISTLSSLYPQRDLWLYHMRLYELLSDEQRSAIALFLRELQDYPRLDTSDQRFVSAALREYWQQFLPGGHENQRI